MVGEGVINVYRVAELATGESVRKRAERERTRGAHARDCFQHRRNSGRVAKSAIRAAFERLTDTITLRVAALPLLGRRDTIVHPFNAHIFVPSDVTARHG